MKKISVLIVCLSIMLQLQAQKQKKVKAGPNPFTVDTSLPFSSPKRHKVSNPIGYGSNGIVQVNIKGTKSFSFQEFSSNLKLERENTVTTEGKLNEHVNYQRMVKLKNKTYFFFRDVDRDAKTEGISALEFSPSDLDFTGNSTPLFQSSDKVRMASIRFSFGYSASIPPQVSDMGSDMGAASDYGYNFITSKDKSKFLYTYSLVPKEKKDAINKDVIGMYVFDENLAKQWGGEFEMPYTEAKMDNLSYTLGSDGRVYLLAKVYETDRPKETKGKDKAPNFHFEVLVYDKGVKTPKKVEIKLDNKFPTEAYIYENNEKNIVLGGFYGKSTYGAVDGAYLVKLDVEKSEVSKVNGGFYEIPTAVIKSFISNRAKKKLDKKAEKNPGSDLAVNDLLIRKIYELANGSTVIIAEQYYVIVYYTRSSNGSTQAHYKSFANDIFVMSIDVNGKLGWVKKIPKAQMTNDAVGRQLSISSFVTENNVHIFYLDNIKNANLTESQAPALAIGGKGGFLTGVDIDANGNIAKYNLGDSKTFKTNFFIRYFVDGGNNNLISTERKKKKNILFSISSK